ncbi:hypothetical protein GCM10027346_39690 [Hymenobacter seoulensis]
MGLLASIFCIISFIEAIRGESPPAAALPAAPAEWSIPAISPEATPSVVVVSVVVAVESAALSLLQLATSREPEQRAARKKADFFMGLVGVSGKMKWESRDGAKPAR